MLQCSHDRTKFASFIPFFYVSTFVSSEFAANLFNSKSNSHFLLFLLLDAKTVYCGGLDVPHVVFVLYSTLSLGFSYLYCPLLHSISHRATFILTSCLLSIW